MREIELININLMPSFGVITIFPEMFPGPLGYSIIGKAFKKYHKQLEIIDLKNFKVQKQIDDTPFGGGVGMLIRPDCLGNAIESVIHKYSRIIFPSPRGVPITQQKIKELKDDKGILFICGRYEGIDSRIIDYYNIEEYCVTETILCGGELPTMLMIEAIARLFCVGNYESLIEESFSQEGVIEHNQFTHPYIWKGIKAPDVLREGNHKKIIEWKKISSIKNTLDRQNKMLKKEKEI
jgi:tRNA (guanine37-N1)-methyltransferase